MKDVTATNNLSSALEPRANLPQAKSAMGKDDFLKLLVTQLQNQDPLKPMEHQEFTAQLAQFSSLEQLSNIGSEIKGLRGGMSDDAKLQALGMIGRKVEAAGQNELDLIQGQKTVLQNLLPEGATPTKASILDRNGQIVRNLEIADKNSAIEWDGKNSDGFQLPAGKYAYRIFGNGKDGKPVQSGSEISGRVTGVEMDGTVPMLVIQSSSGARKVELGKVRQVSLSDSELAVTPKSMANLTVPSAAVTNAPEQENNEEANEQVDVFESGSHAFRHIPEFIR
ncbi:MAG: hypothetical protein HY537_10585 [Deltaproteobacteria bacterium]|nr:hypothetical protein [Deltaproteobacteria bacterium]